MPFCERTRSMEECGGLEDPEFAKTNTKLQISKYEPVLANVTFCCIDCVREHFPEWRRYIAPMETLAERATL